MLVQVSVITSAGEHNPTSASGDEELVGYEATDRAVTAREIALLHTLKSNIWPSVSLSSFLLGQGTFGLQTAVSLDHQNAVGERPSSSRSAYQSISAGPSKGPARAGSLVAPGRRDLATYTREVQSSQQEA